tara:strand:+ start:3364 stop:4617 length:1254 start_codon:yes stop_codon:yes gene_type:complete
MDPEKPYRNALLRDVKELLRLKSVDAILITGDIAFKGDPEEFGFASTWIEELADTVNCQLESVFTVPGNHDVDRNICQQPLVSAVQSSISRACLGYHQEQELKKHLFDDESGAVLFSPVKAYNEFAKFYNCQIYPERPFWKQRLRMDEQTELCIYGLTSTFLSGHQNLDSRPGDLYLSPFQTSLEVNERVINLVMSHHPPEWFLDRSSINQSLNSRSTIQLFGHEHEQRVTRDSTYMRFSAGAINPERHGQDWRPGYNVIDLNIDKSDGKRILIIHANLRAWQGNPEKFVSIESEKGEMFFEHTIALPELHDEEPSIVLKQSPPEAATSQTQVKISQKDKVTSGETTMGDPKTRNLIYRFWKLRTSDRRLIATNLEILSEEEWSLPETERYSRALIRASENALINKLSEEISKAEKK